MLKSKKGGSRGFSNELSQVARVRASITIRESEIGRECYSPRVDFHLILLESDYYEVPHGDVRRGVSR